MNRFCWVVLLILLVGVGCSRREKETIPVMSSSTESEENNEVPAGQLVAQVVLDSIEYLVPREQYLQRFIREFGDNTVVDKVIIRKVHDNKKAKPTYYLVGLGLNNGQYRSMAFELYVASDNALYMTYNAPEFVCEGANCDMCMFVFENNKIIGCGCDGSTETSNCGYLTDAGNKMFEYK